MAGDRKIKIILVDDHPVVLEGLAAGLAQFPGIVISGKASDVAAGKELIGAQGFDLLLTDLYLSEERDGLELLKYAGECGNGCKKAILTYSTRIEDVLDANRAGADGYLIKDSELEEIAAAVKLIHDGGRPPLPPAMEAAVWQKVRTDHEGNGNGALSDREKQVLQLMTQGMTNQEIASSLSFSPRVIRRCNTEIFRKLGVRNRSEAVAKALREKMF